MNTYIIRFFLEDQTIVEYILKAKSILAAENMAFDKYYEFYDKRILYITSEEE